MAVATSMSGDEENDGHENDLIMPGFRFHPTEEELIDFYLRRKVEGKHFNVELITYVDLYRHDPWELPALAAIGEKEWFFYVPRDRKYRNGDRPNRVTTSGYWKATGADRIVRSENSRPIGLKKTLVFYAGKAPKGIRTCWIMNEYRLPPNEAQKYQKTEISICRVYKRSGNEDHLRPPSSSKAKKQLEKCRKGNIKSLNATALTVQESDLHTNKIHAGNISCSITNNTTTSSIAQFTVKTLLEGTTSSVNQPEVTIPVITPLSTSSIATVTVDELNNQQGFLEQGNHLISGDQLPIPISNVSSNPLAAISEKPWEWNPLHEAARDYTHHYYV